MATFRCYHRLFDLQRRRSRFIGLCRADDSCVLDASQQERRSASVLTTTWPPTRELLLALRFTAVEEPIRWSLQGRRQLCSLMLWAGAQVSFSTNNDVATYEGAITGSSIYSGGGADSLVFAGQTTVVFSDALAAGAQVSFSTNNDVATYEGAITGSSVYSGGGADSLVFAGQTTVVFSDSLAAGTQVSLGSNADRATFQGAIAAGTIYGGAGNDSLYFSTVGLTGSTIFKRGRRLNCWRYHCWQQWCELLGWNW